MERRIGDFDPQGLANTAWAFATAGQNEALLFAPLAAAEWQVGNVNGQSLPNTTWAFATSGL